MGAFDDISPTAEVRATDEYQKGLSAAKILMSHLPNFEEDPGLKGNANIDITSCNVLVAIADGSGAAYGVVIASREVKGIPRSENVRIHLGSLMGFGAPIWFQKGTSGNKVVGTLMGSAPRDEGSNNTVEK